MRAECTLQQAIALVNLKAELLHRRLTNCNKCKEFYGEFCEGGERLIQIGLYSFCVRFYGQRRAKRETEKLVQDLSIRTE